jgi:hypothetical protein
MSPTLRTGCDTTRFPPVSTAPDLSSRRDSPVSRRTAIRVGSGGALALVLGGIAGCADSPDDESTTSPPESFIIPEIGEIDAGIIALGRRVIEVTGEADLEMLLAQLPAGAGDPIERAAAVVRADFSAARTVVIDGWVLSVSEARAAAAVSLLCEASSC